MTFGEAIKHVFRNLTTFQGRARRSEFWWFYLFMALVSIPVSILLTVAVLAAFVPVASSIDSGTGEVDQAAVNDLVGPLLGLYAVSALLGLVAFGLQLAVFVRRLHDTGQSGHWMWFSLVGLGIVPLIMAIMEGEPGPNRYGPDPKAAERMPLHGWPQ